MSQAGRTRYLTRSARRGEETFSSPRLALRAKYRVRPAWLIKRLLCRLDISSRRSQPSNWPWGKKIPPLDCVRPLPCCAVACASWVDSRVSLRLKSTSSKCPNSTNTRAHMTYYLRTWAKALLASYANVLAGSSRNHSSPKNVRGGGMIAWRTRKNVCVGG